MFYDQRQYPGKEQYFYKNLNAMGYFYKNLNAMGLKEELFLYQLLNL